MKNIHSNIEKAKKYLTNNDVVAIPTETVYGLAGNAYSNKAVKKIFSLKKRPLKNPLIVHYCRIKDLKQDCILNKTFNKLYRKFCPGPLTFVLNKKKNSKLSKYVNANKKIISMPTHHTGKLLLMTANIDVIRSVTEPTLLPESAPKNIPIIDMIIVAVVKSRTVLGIFSKSMSLTFEEPESLVRKVACPKSRINSLYIANPILCGEYHGVSNPRALVRLSICS